MLLDDGADDAVEVGPDSEIATLVEALGAQAGQIAVDATAARR